MIPNEPLAEENFRALRRDYPDYADVLSAIPESRNYSLEQRENAVLCRDAQGHWLHGPEDPWQEARREADAVVSPEPALYIVIRPGLGYQALALLEKIDERAPGSVLVVVEDRLDLLKAALENMDWAPLLRTNFCMVLVGRPEKVIEPFLERHPKLCLLPATFVASPESALELERSGLPGRLESLRDKVRAAAENELAAFDVRLAERRSQDEPVRVLLAGKDFGYLLRPLADGFRAHGCDVEIDPGETSTRRALREHEWLWRIGAFTPDLVLWMNRSELSQFACHALRTLQVANVLWSVDSPRRLRVTPRELDTVDLHVCFDRESLKEYGVSCSCPSAQLSLGAGIEPLPGCRPADARWPARRGPDIAFVGSLGESRVRDLRELIRSRTPEDLRLLDALAAAPGDSRPGFEAGTGKRYEGWPCLYIDEVRSTRRRIQVLSHLPRRGLKLFGGLDWLTDGGPLAECHAGRAVRYGSDLASVYYHALININVFHAQCIDSTNSRVYDVLAAGGFLLSEDRPVLHREFDVGRHLVTFSSPSEANDKVAYYLAHPAEREAIAREGQRHVLAHHTFAERCGRLLRQAQAFMGRPRPASDDCAAGGCECAAAPGPA